MLLALTGVAYRSHVSVRARSGAIAATVAVHLLLLLALINLSQSRDRTVVQSALQIIDLRQLPPPEVRRKPAVRPAIKPALAAARQASGAARRSAPKPPAGTTEAAATPEVRPIPAPLDQSPAVPSSAPGIGAASGGNGSGYGPGGNGSGPAGGNDLAEPPRLTSPVMSARDFSGDQLGQWPRGATVFLRLRVDPGGRVAECIIDRRSGVAAIDSEICNLAHERLRFRPALNRNGQKVAGWFGYAQPAPQ